MISTENTHYSYQYFSYNPWEECEVKLGKLPFGNTLLHILACVSCLQKVVLLTLEAIVNLHS